ncbi:hypothetical protein EV44_g1953 [Erysiphe necator]|uniref:Uncharacterized protein n=1 Tax=Uncinula necator TaxID=52586 RepID=A0A0B1P518_UNCNE|nr:hypothetical protein EV44_g1953 [Erysiphe necator]
MEINNKEFDNDGYENFTTELTGDINGHEVTTILNNQSVFHSLTKTNIFIDDIRTVVDSKLSTFPEEQDPTSRQQQDSIESDVFLINRYSFEKFHRILPDTGAANISTAGELQFIALKRKLPSLQIDTSKANYHTIKFGVGKSNSLGTIKVDTLIGEIIFHLIPVNTPFLLCLADIDRLGVTIDNLRNFMIQGPRVIPIVRKWGYPWLLLNHQKEVTITYSHLTEPKLRQLYRRFGHRSVHRVYKILQRAGHDDIEYKTIEHLTKVCHHCQINAKSPGRFRFTLKDDYEFNYSVIVDVLYLDRRPVLQAVDGATAFQAARFLKDMSASVTNLPTSLMPFPDLGTVL